MTAKPANATEALRELVAAHDACAAASLAFNEQLKKHGSADCTIPSVEQTRLDTAWAAARTVLAEPPKEVAALIERLRKIQAMTDKADSGLLRAINHEAMAAIGTCLLADDAEWRDQQIADIMGLHAKTPGMGMYDALRLAFHAARLSAPVPAREWADMRERDLLIAIKNAASIAINESEDDEQDNTIVSLEKARAVNKAISDLGKHYLQIARESVPDKEK